MTKKSRTLKLSLLLLTSKSNNLHRKKHNCNLPLPNFKFKKLPFNRKSKDSTKKSILSQTLKIHKVNKKYKHCEKTARITSHKSQNSPVDADSLNKKLTDSIKPTAQSKFLVIQ